MAAMNWSTVMDCLSMSDLTGVRTNLPSTLTQDENGRTLKDPPSRSDRTLWQYATLYTPPKRRDVSMQGGHHLHMHYLDIQWGFLW
uniref:Uncharacterized protein n=1 Tax=Vitis vinifera TaxID=29760 RepID=A5APV2_VITVI|nr:hypothetical protein VITISV_040080 [Vitis vinifera]